MRAARAHDVAEAEDGAREAEALDVAAMSASPANLLAPYKEMGRLPGSISRTRSVSVAVDGAGRGEDEVFTPLRRAASSELYVAMVPCSRSRRVRSRPQRASGLAARWNTMAGLASRSGRLEGRRGRAGRRRQATGTRVEMPGDELALADREVVVDRNGSAFDQPIDQVASDEPGSAGQEEMGLGHRARTLAAQQAGGEGLRASPLTTPWGQSQNCGSLRPTHAPLALARCPADRLG